DPILKVVRKVRDAKTLEQAVIEMHQRGMWPLFDVSDEQDFKDATKVIAEIDQNGLGLPNKEYYAPTDDKGKETLAKYQEHVERMLVLAAVAKKKAKDAAADVLKVETAIAAVSKAPRERREPKTMYNRVDRDGLAKLTTRFDWDLYFKSIGFPELREI